MFKLSTGTSTKVVPRGKASPEDIARYEAIGYTHIVYEGRSHFVYISDDSERDAFKIELGLPHYEWFQESTGKRNWVLYNPEQVKPDRNWKGKKVLKFNKEEYKGDKFELPINASSCCGMFSWTTLPKDFRLSSRFDTRDIVDMNLMFAGCIMSDDFHFNDKFFTKNVKDMRYMFYRCVVPSGLKFELPFTTENTELFDFMFSEAKLPKDFKLSESFDTKSAVSMDHMFYDAKFMGEFDLGRNFVVSPNIVKRMMFSECMIVNEMVPPEHSEDYNYIKMKYMPVDD